MRNFPGALRLARRELPDFLTRDGDKGTLCRSDRKRRQGNGGALGRPPHESGDVSMGRVQEHAARGRA